jgi:ABC-type transport system involved in multi-copper enzyme maturation permease subunit
MHKIIAIAQNTFKEAIRQKILYALIFFTILLFCASYFLAQLSIGDAASKIVKDMSLASIYFMGVFIALSMGIGLVFKEIDRKTIYTILSKPVSRMEFLVGKFFGLIFTVGVEIALMGGLMFAMLSFYPEPIDWNLWKAIILIFIELCVLISVTLVFSSYSSSFMTALFCFSALIMGHLTDDLISIISEKAQYMAKKQKLTPLMDALFTVGEKILSIFNLDYFAINSKIVHGVVIPWSYIWYGVLYGACFSFVFIIIASVLFSKKDLK